MTKKLLPLVLALALLTGVLAVMADGNANLIQNPSFEGEYSAYIPPGGHPDCEAGICTTAQMAPNWIPWWRSHDPNDPDYIIRMPEYKPADGFFNDPPRVRSGEKAQQFFTFFTTHEAGFLQQVAVTPGRSYQFQIWGHAWSADDDDDAYSGPNDGLLGQKVGIDPTGGTDWQSPNIVWGPERLQYDFFGLFEVTATAQASVITVFTYSNPEYPVKHNDVYWDDAELILLELPVTPLAITLIADIDIPQTVDYPISINWTSPWNATLDPGGTLIPTLSSTSGAPGDPLTATINTNGIPLGTYATTLTLTANPAVPGSPASIPIKLIVAEEVSRVYMPIIFKN